jgi:hypothetical protein
MAWADDRRRSSPRAGVEPSTQGPDAKSRPARVGTVLVGLERLCNSGARGPLSLEQLSALPDGRLAYRMRRASPTAETHLVLSPARFLRRVAALVPPPRANLVSGVTSLNPSLTFPRALASA